MKKLFVIMARASNSAFDVAPRGVFTDKDVAEAQMRLFAVRETGIEFYLEEVPDYS